MGLALGLGLGFGLGFALGEGGAPGEGGPSSSLVEGLSLWSSAVITTISPAHGSVSVSTCAALMVRAVQTRSTSSEMTWLGLGLG